MGGGGGGVGESGGDAGGGRWAGAGSACDELGGGRVNPSSRALQFRPEWPCEMFLKALLADKKSERNASRPPHHVSEPPTGIASLEALFYLSISISIYIDMFSRRRNPNATPRSPTTT